MNCRLPDLRRLRAALDYNPDDGTFRWKEDRGKRFKAGSLAGTTAKDGYVTIGLDGTNYKAHRLAYYYVTGHEVPDSVAIDHINQITGDNRFCNLRMADHHQNLCNSGLRSDNSTGHKGIYFQAGKWVASINSRNKRYYLGRYNNMIDAIEAYNAASIIHHGDYSSVKGK